ncbi:mannose-6-phosphate isomerase [Candidatus Pacearchaeota archaeon]|nr:MAG: mannose-6-phosphate isomerase [Candidatus Pacearchaeota archaeon]
MKRKVVRKPWGGFERFTLNEESTVKILTLNPRQKISLQRHKNRSEFWKFLDNPARVTLGKRTFKVGKGDEVFIPRRALHRVEALDKPVRILEIAFGKFDERDIERLDDIYGRA